jgi:predicted CoA-substrate-specific enzyme activase
VLGIDLGSRFVKLAEEEEPGKLELRLWDTVDFYTQFCREEEGRIFLKLERLEMSKSKAVTVTGYGRNILTFSGTKVISELKAHTLGAVRQTGLNDFILLDIGGQDSKVIQVQGGRMRDFRTNDRCAACTGRYLENMARVLNLSLEQLSAHWENPVELSSTCAVFGESELIAKLAQGEKPEKLAAGVNYSIFKRFKPLLTEYKFKTLVLVGGVAFNKALRHILKERLNCEVIVPPYPQHNAALGCLKPWKRE